jgi:hypothetical protein
MNARRGLRLAGLLLLAPAGCSGGNHEVNSGGDAARETAATLELGKEVEDSVNFNDGDRTDWKTFEVPGAGKIGVDVMWGNASARCGFRVIGAAGEDVKRLDTIGGDPRKIVKWDVPGAATFFLRFQCEDEGDYSAYLLKVTFLPVAGPPATSPDDGSDDDDDTTSDDGPAVDGAKPATPGLLGEIKKMTKGKKGTLLTIDKGSAEKVSVGMTGEILGIEDATFTVLKVAAKSCTAETTLDAKSIGENVVVRFHPK